MFASNMRVEQGECTGACQNGGAAVTIALLGGLRVQVSGRAVAVPPESKAGQLLRCLALQADQGVPRDELVAFLWPDAGPQQVGRSLNTLVTEVRKLLKDALGETSPLLYADGCYRLNRAAGVLVDVACFDRWVDVGLAARRAGQAAAARDAFLRALRLYRGDLYLGVGLWDDVRGFVEQERLRGRCLLILTLLADMAGRADDDTLAMGFVERLLRLEPCSEEAHRVAMHCHMLRGQRSLALRQYRTCAAALAREYDAAPHGHTVRLFELIRSNDWRRELSHALLGGGAETDRELAPT